MTGGRNLLERLLDGSSLLLKAICVLIMALLVVAVAVQVFSRYVLNAATSWSEPLSQIAFIWLTLFGAAVVTREKGMLYVDVVQNRLKGLWLKVCKLLCDLVSLVVCGCWVYSSALQIGNTWDIMEGGLPIRRGWIYIGILAAFLFMFLYLAEDVVRLLAGRQGERRGEVEA